MSYWRNNGEANAERAADCRKDTQRSDDVDLSTVVNHFCRAVKDEGFMGAVSDCEGIIASRRWWPTYDGGLTDAFNKAYPYPGDRLLQPPPADNSRPGDREGFTREPAE